VTNGSSFQFRLERVRALRERREHLARRALAEAIAQMSCSRERLRTVEADLEAARAAQRHSADRPTPLSGAELQAGQAFVERVEAQRHEGAREVQRDEAHAADRDADLGRAAREREMLERLRARQLDEHRRESLRREGNALDELAIDRFRRSAA
jgi:flagellar FliJ protein